jgi:hypothetical protein
MLFLNALSSRRRSDDLSGSKAEDQPVGCRTFFHQDMVILANKTITGNYIFLLVAHMTANRPPRTYAELRFLGIRAVSLALLAAHTPARYESSEKITAFITAL